VKIGTEGFSFEEVTGLLKSAGAAATANFKELAAPAFTFVRRKITKFVKNW